VRPARRLRPRLWHALRRLWIGARRLLRDPRGLPRASRLALAFGQTLALLATVWMLAVATWEIAAPFGPGREAVSASVTLGGENMLRWGTGLPVTEHTLSTPTTDNVSFEHPFGVYWTAALFRALFGHHDWVCRLPALLFSALTPGLVYALGRALYGPLAGGLAALAFVATPIALTTAQLNGFEVPLLFGALLACVGTVRMRQTGRRGWGVVAWLGMALSLNSDWPALGFVAALLSILLIRLFVFRANRREFDAGARLFAWASVLTVTLIVYYAWVFFHAGRLPVAFTPAPDLILLKNDFGARALAARRELLDSLFPPLIPAVTAVAVPAMIGRSLLLRRDVELVPLALFAMGALQLAWFNGKTELGMVLPHAFAGFFAISAGALFHAVTGLFAFGKRRLSRDSLPSVRFPWVALGLCAVPFGVLLPAALDALRASRKAGTSLTPEGSSTPVDRQLVAAFRFWSSRLADDAAVVLDRRVAPALWMPWVLGRPIRTKASAWSRNKDRYVALDARYADSGELRTRAQASELLVLGPYFLFDRARPSGPASVFAIEQREPTLFERLFVSTNHAVREVVADPFHTYEVREVLGQTPNPAPGIAPRTWDQIRVAHNLAVSLGDVAGAAALRQRLVDSLDTRPATEYQDGTRLLGIRLDRGASEMLHLYFESRGPADQRFVVRSRAPNEKPPALLRDEHAPELGAPSFPLRDSWQIGYLYSLAIELSPARAPEKIVGSWLATNSDIPILPKNLAPEITLLVRP
jgi:Dolichyl-phosphate-mannose-protein mannosyltransferase